MNEKAIARAGAQHHRKK